MTNYILHTNMDAHHYIVLPKLLLQYSVVQSWKKRGKRVGKIADFGPLSPQVLVPRQFVRVCHSVNMKYGVQENNVAVTPLHNCGKCCSQFLDILQRLKISHMFIYREIKNLHELWRVEDRAQLGCLKSLRAQATTKTVQEWIRRNLLWKKITS
jgi:hypothetical protein